MVLFVIDTSMLSLIGLWVTLSFIRERGWRPAIIMASATLLMIAFLIAIFTFFPAHLTLISLALAAVTVLAMLLLFTPFGNPGNTYKPATERFDERDIMFARARYKEGDEAYEAFYAEKPEKKKRDDFTRSLPNLGEPGGKTWDNYNPQIAGSIFDWIERVRDTVRGPVHAQQVPLEPLLASQRLKGLARFLGAADAGTTEVGAEHVYSHVGRGGGTWGAEIDPESYPFAIVYTVEMREDFIGSAPWQPALADSGRQYLEAAKIGFAIAEYIRSLGYDARAHVDGNYRLIMPTLAVDAGLGEIGRHSLLITPAQGSRVRIGAVTTELPLQQAEQISFGVDDFCTICKKCAKNCPSNSIPREGKTRHRGSSYWKINEESCYRAWRGFGTDCGICVNVCPYSRPSGLIHSFVRAACKQNPVSRRLFHALDDLFYGKRPRSSRYPDWMESE